MGSLCNHSNISLQNSIFDVCLLKNFIYFPAGFVKHSSCIWNGPFRIFWRMWNKILLIRILYLHHRTFGVWCFRTFGVWCLHLITTEKATKADKIPTFCELHSSIFSSIHKEIYYLAHQKCFFFKTNDFVYLW